MRARIELKQAFWRAFCFLDKGKLVILLNGFTKRLKNSEPIRISKAEKIANEGILHRNEIIMETKTWTKIKDDIYRIKWN